MKRMTLTIGAALFVLTGCDRDTTPAAPVGESGSTNAVVEADAPARAGTDRVAEARRYLASFTSNDPDACFEDVTLAMPKLERQFDGGKAERPPARVVVLVDGSGSMAGRIGKRTKLELAREAAQAFVDGLPATAEVSLLAFGQQGDNSPAGRPRSCAAIDTLVPATREHDAIRSATGRLRAVGWTPLAAGLAAAEKTLARADLPGDQVIYVVSDGEETCGGDPVATAARINDGDRRAIVNIIGFGLPANEEAALRRVAGAGGGNFVNVATEAAAERALARVRETNRATTNTVRTSAATTANTVRTSAALTRARVCTSKIITAERVSVSRDLTERTIRGERPAYHGEIEALLTARHDAIRAREEAFDARLSGANERQQAEIDRTAVSAR